ncbi:Vacuolar ATPase assembly integral membrane protein-like protein [Hapsidospora chrysogenum ATCC 11550]|uniref:Vacuolar ATPase assembly integral membrane protein-like protein n=1 Tax=Hapsidospora chrysogenum (strain ATCC 11550 / CBS 779.69 / DSM 880 / IAM 14645 / JCM 23072 / IMI 49137) TaxID=857340 RepID=A0A086T8V1_HAPC1|nr:Vacuolar ATPase assembly integral membrane protein-like protein [Hapsidospora chrysogenum ATCC 11550]
MATRRIPGSEKTIIDKDDSNQEKSNISPAVPGHVIYKLLAFSFAMIVIPISSYFLTVNTVFKGNSSFAGGLAALLANVVLISYIVVAMNEDTTEKDGDKKPETKKER